MKNDILFNRFIGREKELKFLKEIIFNSRKPIYITGDPGVGKTFFLSAFIENNKTWFNDGYEFIHGDIGLEKIQEMIYRYKETPVKHIFIIDDIEKIDQEFISTIYAMKSNNPNIEIIVTTRICLKENSDSTILNIEGLSESEVIRFFKQNSINMEYSYIQKLMDISNGNPLFATLLVQIIKSQNYTIDEIFKYLKDFNQSGIIKPDGLSLSEDSLVPKPIISDISEVNDELLKRLHKDPEYWYKISPHKFEKVIAEIFIRLGYYVDPTSKTRDGGFDLYVASKKEIGIFLYLVECKRFIPPHKVGVELIRNLHGVVDMNRANAGILVTTSYFTNDAINFQKKVKFQIQLRDYLNLQIWLDKILGKK